MLHLQSGVSRKFVLVMSLSVDYKNSISEEATANNGGSNSRTAAAASSELKLYQAFIFSVPIFFTFILLFLFYLFYLRRRRVDWSSLRMRTASSERSSTDDIDRCELGLKKELREMLPIIVFNQSFSVKDTQCSVCLGDYEGDDRLQQIPGCGHTFHMECIDLWLATHTTCPLCRQSLLIIASTKQEEEEEEEEEEHDDDDEAHITTSQSNCDAQNTTPSDHHQDGVLQMCSEEDPQTSQQPSDGDERVMVVAVVSTVGERDRDFECDDDERLKEI